MEMKAKAGKRIAIAGACLFVAAVAGLIFSAERQSDRGIRANRRDAGEAAGLPAGSGGAPGGGRGPVAGDELPEAYRAFLRDGVSAIAADWFRPGYGYSGIDAVKAGKSYSLRQLADAAMAGSGRAHDAEPLEYALLDSGDDGKKELAVRLHGAGAGGPEDTGTTTLILKEMEGRLLLCDAFASWSRGEEIQYYYGFREGGGSSGAGDHVYTACLVDKEGRRQQIFTCETLTGAWMERINKKAVAQYQKIYGDAYPASLQMQIFTVGKTAYPAYCVAASGAEKREKEQIAALLACFGEQGVAFTAPEEIDARIAAQKRALGIKEEWCAQRELEWRAFPAIGSQPFQERRNAPV